MHDGLPNDTPTPAPQPLPFAASPSPPPADAGLLDHLHRDDVAAIVRMLGEAIVLTEPIEARRARIFARLAELIDADIWCWIRSRFDPERGLPVPLNVLEGGWRDDAERTAFMTANYSPIVNEPIVHAVLQTQHRTFLFDEILRPGEHDAAIRFWQSSTGLGDCILCTYPLGNHTWSNFGFHRRLGRPTFTARERGIAHVVLSQLDVLHRPGIDMPGNDDALFELSPRQRQTLVHLLGGDSAKRIAQQMRLSVHTVNGYIQTIYKQLGVTSRAGLMRKFMSGGATTGSTGDAK